MAARRIPKLVHENLWKVKEILNIDWFNLDTFIDISKVSYSHRLYRNEEKWVGFFEDGEVISYYSMDQSPIWHNPKGPCRSSGMFCIYGNDMDVFEFIKDIKCEYSESQKVELVLKYG